MLLEPRPRTLVVTLPMADMFAAAFKVSCASATETSRFGLEVLVPMTAVSLESG